MNSEREKKNQLWAVLTSLTVHLVLIALFLFVMGFTAPDPPMSEMGSGVELQLGVDAFGSGDVQQPVAITPTETPEETIPEEAKKEIAEAVQPKVTESNPEPDKPKEELSSEEESPVAAREVKKEIKKEKKPDPPVEKKVVKKIEKKEEKKIEKPLAEYKDPSETKATTDTKSGGTKEGAEKKNSKGVSQGDDKGKVGDKGSPEGVADSKGQYTGKPGAGGDGTGGGGGKGISVTGFSGFARVKLTAPEIPDDSNGIYEFEVLVNADGEVQKITTLQRGLSIEAENIFKAQIRKLVFEPINSNLPASNAGRITYKVTTGK